MAWWWGVAEGKHELQNPTSAEKIRLLGQRLDLGPESHVLDVASGRGGPALLLAGEFGCRLTCVENSEEFLAAAERRSADAGLESLIELVRADALEFPLEPERYDAVLCLGASFIWGGLAATLAALSPTARRGGFVVSGEPYWRTWPLPEGFEPGDGEEFAPLRETVVRFRDAGLSLVTLIDSSLDDWDRYESLHWLAVEEWVHDHPEDPDAQHFAELSERFRERYLRWERDLLGWAIFVCRAR